MTINTGYAPGSLLDSANIWTAAQTFDDVIPLWFGTDQDIALQHISAFVAPDAGDTDYPALFKGTSDHQAIAADSLVISNVVASGDIGMYVNVGGHTMEAFLIKPGTATITLGFGLTAPIIAFPADVAMTFGAGMGSEGQVITSVSGAAAWAAAPSGTVPNSGVTAGVLIVGDGANGYNVNAAAATGVNDIYFESGAVLNWNDGDVTLTHAADTLTMAGGNLVLNDTVALAFGTSSAEGTLYSDGTNVIFNHIGSNLLIFTRTAASASIADVAIRSSRTGVNHGALRFQASRGDYGAPTAIVSGDDIGRIFAAPYDDAGYDAGAYIGFWATENQTATNHGQSFRIYTVPDASVTATLAFTVSQAQDLVMNTDSSIHPATDGQGSLGIQTTNQWGNVWADAVNGADIVMANQWRMLESELYPGYVKGWAIGYDDAWESGKSIWAGKQDIGAGKPVFAVTDSYIEYKGRRITPEILDRLLEMV